MFVLFDRQTLTLRKIEGRKAFNAKPSINIVYLLKEENMFMVPNHKKTEIIMRIHVCLIWWENFDSKENGKRKSF